MSCLKIGKMLKRVQHDSITLSKERVPQAGEGFKNVIASESEAIHSRLPRKSSDFLAMTVFPFACGV